MEKLEPKKNSSQNDFTSSVKGLKSHALKSIVQGYQKVFLILPSLVIKKGSFTGAIADRKGAFLEANKGIIFLDEIGKTSKTFQAKLLRVLQDKEIHPVGSDQPVKIDVRIILGLNIDPSVWLANNDVLPDFLNRINAHLVRIPSLRERKNDIPSLVKYFISKYSKLFNSSITGIADNLIPKFVKNDWGLGNVRELENVISDLVAVTDATGLIEELPNYFLSMMPSPTIIEQSSTANGKPISWSKLEEQVNKIYRDHIEPCLRLHHGNVSKTAVALDAPRMTLKGIIDRVGIGLTEIRQCRKSVTQNVESISKA